MAWGVNTVFGLTPGYDVKLLESNGRGWESFTGTIERSEREAIIAVTGSTVLVDGGTGFANADVHKSIRADLIEATARALEHTINTQVIPQWVIERWGDDALSKCPTVAWDTTPPKDQQAEATALQALGAALTTANQALAPYGRRLDARELAIRFGLPLEEAPAPAAPAASDDGGEVVAVNFNPLEAAAE
jgi:phage gp29-like protein